ncbi:transcriptional regulator, TetR family [Nocardia amikacinitolerans]|uniref:Transcriptional regulator, TetR family n=1 Tax=Nocardia amikacinitolerans TaxID=756689 RepID=A0A285LT67_9NOCA|nr:TetR/AcrR family transcriptional regulator [Nocardia amikacinitolerans]MCP2277234.1 transcriptional regulator, TetR family [Nocardia amikacinitolerans]SNY88130.1 transcriptional regulator, TetR family [Nocardia amikacinitolerans]
MSPRTDSRQRFLDAAADLFHTKGYHATGLNQLVSAGGAPKGSLYFHFPGGKEQLAAEALTQSSEELRDTLRAILADGDTDAVFAAMAHNLEASDFQRGCPLATVALDAAAESELIRQACVAGFDSWRAAIEEFLREKGLDGERAANLSVVALTMLEGGLMLAKTQRDIAPLRTVADYLRTTLERELS